ncbi:MAG TPA: hypothetical protein VFN16_10060 [Saccharospirillum sp.]|nr:hypothetical protein [Saccharospirillum sp.]
MTRSQDTLHKTHSLLRASWRRPALLSLLTIIVLAMAGCNLEPGGFGNLPKGPVTLYWSEPMTRVNGDPLADDDIIAFAIRYRHETSRRFTTLVVENSGADTYYFPSITDPDNTIFQMAAVDKDGLYSNFVTAAR